MLGPDVEVHTRSVPAAASLVQLGYEPLGVLIKNGTPVLRFSPAAREALNTFFETKAKLDAMLEANRTSSAEQAR